MDVVPNQIPQRLIHSLDVDETAPVAQVEKSSDSGSRRGKYIALIVGATLVSAVGFIFFGPHADKYGDRLNVPTFIKARTQGLIAAPDSAATPAQIVIELNADMIRVSAISLGHPRLAIINGKPVAEGENVRLQAPNSSVAVILRVVSIGDGRIDLSDGKKMFSARLTIPSPPRPKVN
jgi:hypothetical protein